MSLTKIGSIGINTGIAFAGVTTIATLNGSDSVLSVGGTVNFVSDVSIGGTVSIAGNAPVKLLAAREPLNVVAVTTPVKNPSPSTLKVIPLPTTIPSLAVIRPTASTFVTSS